jgi:hypothetical protein
MTTLTLSVPEALLRRASQRLGKNGRVDVREFLLRSIQSLAMDGKPVSAAEEAKLLAGLNSPLIKADDAFWQTKQRRFDARHRKSAKRR